MTERPILFHGEGDEMSGTPKKWDVHPSLLPAVLRGTAIVLRINPQEKIYEAPDLCEQAAHEIDALRASLAAAHARIEELRAHALKYVVPVIDSTVSETEQAIARALDRHGERHSEVHGVYPTLLFSAMNAIKALRLARHRASKELATVTRERDEARAEVERLSQILHQWDAERAELKAEVERLRRYRDDMHDTFSRLASVVGMPADKGADALLHEVERLQEALRKEAHIIFDGPPGPQGPHFVEVEDGRGRSVRCGEWRRDRACYWSLVISGNDIAAIDAARKEKK